MLDKLNATKNLGLRQKLDYAVVKPIIWSKYKLGLGIEEATELHKQIKRKFKRCRAMVFNIDDIWSADLDTSKEKLSEENKGYKYLLNVINVFSKYAYSIPFKSKSSDFIIEAFNKLFKFDNRKPNNYELIEELSSSIIN